MVRRAGFLCLAVASAACARGAGSGVPAAGAVRAAIARFAEAYARHDVAVADGLYAPDAVVFGPSLEMRGWQEYRRVWAAFLAEFPRATLRIDGLEVRIRGAVAWAWGDWHEEYSDRAGATFVQDGRLSFVLERAGDGWRIVQQHASLPARAAGGLEVPLGRGGSGRLEREGQSLRVALAGGGAGLATVYLAVGDDVLALHASAALGTARYHRGARGDWERVRDFSWSCRDPGDRPGRERFRAAEHWLANVRQGGGADRDYDLDVDALGAASGGAVRIVLVYYVYPGGIAAWPADVGDATVDEELLRGSPPARARFALERWGRIPW